MRDAATKIGISHGYLDKLEKGVDPRTQTNNKPTPDTLKLIAAAYHLDYMSLMVLCGYVELNTLKIPQILASTPIALYEGLEGLSDEGMQDVLKYINYVKAKENDSNK